jgi:Ca-activated chloride channel homolog
MILIHPFYSLFILIPLFLIVFYVMAQRRANHDLEVFAAKSLLPKVVDYSGQKLRFRQRILRIIGLLLLIVALCGPGWGYRWQELRSQGLEIIFAIDTSKSMMAGDIKPSRLERAKLALIDFLGRIEGNKIGLIAFSGTSFLACPLTLDYSAFEGTLDSLSVNTIPRGGTAIGPAIANARQAFLAAGAGNKIMVLITDGENHEGDPRAEAKLAAR